MAHRGAGGSEGGLIAFFVGLIMMTAGGYLFLRAIIVRPSFSLAFSVGGFPVTTGMILVPLIFGIGVIFYNSRSWLGWLLTGGALVAMFFGVIANLNIRMITMSLFDLLVILTLLIGGIGLFLRSLRTA